MKLEKQILCYEQNNKDGDTNLNNLWNLDSIQHRILESKRTEKVMDCVEINKDVNVRQKKVLNVKIKITKIGIFRDVSDHSSKQFPEF